MIASNDKIAVAACHLDEGRRVIDLLRKCIASGERTPPLQRYHRAISIPVFTIWPCFACSLSHS